MGGLRTFAAALGGGLGQNLALARDVRRSRLQIGDPINQIKGYPKAIRRRPAHQAGPSVFEGIAQPLLPPDPRHRQDLVPQLADLKPQS